MVLYGAMRMPLPIVTDSYLVRLVWTSTKAPRPASNDLCIHDDAGGHTGTDVYNALNANVTQSMWEFTADACAVYKVVTTKLDGTAASVDHLTGSPSKWTGPSGDDLILQGSSVVTLRTGFRGRSYRGRIYVPWVAETAQTNGTLDATNLGTMQTAWGTFSAAMKTAGFPLHVLSKKHSTSTEIASVTCQPYVKTQRRRSRR